MTTVVLLAIFSAVMAIFGHLFVLGTMHPHEMTRLHTEKTLAFFENIGTIVQQSITPESLQAISAGDITSGTTVTDYIKNNPTLRMMGSGNFENLASDDWGKPIQGSIAQELQVLFSDPATGSIVAAPVTAFAFISAGPDSEISATVMKAVEAAKTVTMVSNLASYQYGQTIFYTFTDLTAQRVAWERMKDDLDTIAKLTKITYQQSVLAASDPSVVPMPALEDENLRRSLGIQALVDDITRPAVGAPYGRLAVTFTRRTTTVPNDTLQISVQNDTVRPTPWTVSYTIVLKAGGSL